MSELKHAFKIYFPYIKLTRGSPLKVPLVYCTCAVGVCVVWDLSVVYLMMTKPNVLSKTKLPVFQSGDKNENRGLA